MLDAGYLILKKAALESATGTTVGGSANHLSPPVIASLACLSRPLKRTLALLS